MKRYHGLVVTALLLTIMLMGGCSEKHNGLTEVNIEDLNVPQDFNYQMIRMVEVTIHGDYQLPLRITDLDGKVLFRGIMNPSTGLRTKINLSNTDKQIIVSYYIYEQKLTVDQNTIDLNLSQQGD